MNLTYSAKNPSKANLLTLTLSLIDGDEGMEQSVHIIYTYRI